jgi:hypothetical protein
VRIAAKTTVVLGVVAVASVIGSFWFACSDKSPKQSRKENASPRGNPSKPDHRPVSQTIVRERVERAVTTSRTPEAAVSPRTNVGAPFQAAATPRVQARLAELDRAMQNQGSDSWSVAQERAWEAVLHQDDFSDLTVHSLKCSKTLCRIELTGDEIRSLKPRLKQTGLLDATHFTMVENGPATIVHVSKTGLQLPDADGSIGTVSYEASPR